MTLMKCRFDSVLYSCLSVCLSVYANTVLIYLQCLVCLLSSRDLEPGHVEPGHKYEFEVAMTCGGCSGAVTRVLSKLGDEVKFEIDLPKKLVWIESEKDVDYLTEQLKKCGKEVKYNGTK
ncbi:unnamed protein product [Merluccius merluccius]